MKYLTHENNTREAILSNMAVVIKRKSLFWKCAINKKKEDFLDDHVCRDKSLGENVYNLYKDFMEHNKTSINFKLLHFTYRIKQRGKIDK